MSDWDWSRNEIGELDEPEPDEDYGLDHEMEPTITVSKKQAKHLYHGMYRTDYPVELPDGSYGQLTIAPSKFNRTLRGHIYVRWNRLKWRVGEQVGEALRPLYRRIDEWIEALDENPR